MRDHTCSWLKTAILLLDWLGCWVQAVTPQHAAPDGTLFRRISEDGADADLDGPRPRGALRKASLIEARSLPAPVKPKLSALNLALPNISGAIEEAARAWEPDDTQPLMQPSPSGYKAAASQLWRFREDGNLRSLDPAAHDEWSRVSLCEPPPHLKHLINAGRVNHAQQPPSCGGVPLFKSSSSHNGQQQPRPVRRSVDVRRSIAGRGMRTGAADRVTGGRVAPRDMSPRDAITKLPGLQESPASSLPAQRATAAKELLGDSINRNSSAKEKPSQRVSFNGGNRVNFERGLDALRASLHESPAAELLAHRGPPLPSASSTGGKADLHDWQTIGRKLPRVKVAIP